MPWDTIPPVRYRTFDIDEDILAAVKKSHLNRLNESPNMKYILNLRERYDLVKNKKELSLNIDNRKKEKAERKDWIFDIENTRRENVGLTRFETYSDMEDFNKEKDEEDLDIDMDSDYLLQETANIIADYIYLNNKILITKLGQ